MAQTYFLAASLVTLRKQINARWPNRDKASDGWIGDISHSARISDHNPDWADGGIVRAIDIDEDGINTAIVLKALLADDRTEYVIYEKRIWTHSKGWQPYSGPNGHTQHIHVSIGHQSKDAVGTNWALGSSSSPSAPVGNTKPNTVKQNSKNSKQDNIAIAELLNGLGYEAGIPDGVPGTYLRDGVRAYQNAQTYFPKMNRDGDWGPMTQAHYEWTRDELQRVTSLYAASNRLGNLREDGDHAALTKKHIMAVMESNGDKGEPYYEAGGRKADGIPGPIYCKMLGIPKHPSL